ncbi:MAG: hypothetical protein AAF499_05090 [Pseudomonadota bacterium]
MRNLIIVFTALFAFPAHAETEGANPNQVIEPIVHEYVLPHLSTWQSHALLWLAEPCDHERTDAWVQQWQEMSPIWALPPLRRFHPGERLARYVLSDAQKTTLAQWTTGEETPPLPLLALIESARANCELAKAVSARVERVAKDAALKELVAEIPTQWIRPDGSGAFFDEIDVLHALSQRMVEPLRALLDPERVPDESAQTVTDRVQSLFFAGAPDRGFYALRAQQNTLAARSLDALRAQDEMPAETLLQATDSVLGIWQIGAGFNSADGD